MIISFSQSPWGHPKKDCFVSVCFHKEINKKKLYRPAAQWSCHLTFVGPSGRLCQIWRSSLKAVLTYHVHKNGSDGQRKKKYIFTFRALELMSFDSSWQLKDQSLQFQICFETMSSFFKLLSCMFTRNGKNRKTSDRADHCLGLLSRESIIKA